jgi:tRNA pseudouridine13 synthase
MASDDSPTGPPQKRLRLSTPDELGRPATTDSAPNGIPKQPVPENEAEDDQLQKEIKAGITEFVSSDTPGFTGTLKQRYEQRDLQSTRMKAECFTITGTPTS